MASTGPPRRFRFADDVIGQGLINAPAEQTDSAKLTRFKKARTLCFSEWRRGNYAWDETARRADIDAVVYPKPGGWDPWDVTDPRADGLLDGIRASRRTFRAENPDPADNAVLRPAQAVGADLPSTTINERLTPLGLKHVRPLGAGGDTAAFIFTIKDTDRRYPKVVAKINKQRGAFAVKKELTTLKVNKSIANLP